MVKETEKTALLVMDVQPGVVDRIENKDEYLAKVQAAVDWAHQKQMPVIYVVVGFRPGFPEVSRRNKSFGAIKAAATKTMIDPRPVIEPAENDIVVIKHRVSAFSGSDLATVLGAQDIEHLVLAGIATSGVVLSTVREAADKDFRLTVVEDLCADFDPEVHRLLLEKIFPRQAEVITSGQWLARS